MAKVLIDEYIKDYFLLPKDKDWRDTIPEFLKENAEDAFKRYYLDEELIKDLKKYDLNVSAIDYPFIFENSKYLWNRILEVDNNSTPDDYNITDFLTQFSEEVSKEKYEITDDFIVTEDNLEKFEKYHKYRTDLYFYGYAIKERMKFDDIPIILPNFAEALEKLEPYIRRVEEYERLAVEVASYVFKDKNGYMPLELYHRLAQGDKTETVTKAIDEYEAIKSKLYDNLDKLVVHDNQIKQISLEDYKNGNAEALYNEILKEQL